MLGYRQYTSAIAKQNQTEAKKLRAKIAALEDANASMSIAPLIKAGEFNTISESLTEADVAIRDSKFGEWLETAVDKLPSGIGGVAKNLLMTKDSAAFKGLNRMVQYGDFVAKAALLEHLTETGMEEQQALDRIMEEFVQYNRLPGRGRDKLESLGVLWFYSYKLRILKVAQRMLRERPCHHPPPTIAPTMPMTAIPTKTERKRQGRSVRSAEERRCRTRKMRVHGPIRPAPGISSTRNAAHGERRLIRSFVQASLR